MVKMARMMKMLARTPEDSGDPRVPGHKIVKSEAK